MQEIIIALTEILAAATGAGEDLDGYAVIDDENDAFPEGDHIIAVIPGMENFVKADGFGYEYATITILIRVIVRVDEKAAKKPFSASKRLAAESSRLARKTVYSQPNLVCTSYPAGLVADEKCTKILEDRPALMSQDGVWFSVNQLTFQTNIIYRNGIINLA